MSTYQVGIVGAGVIGAGLARLFSGRGAATVVIAPRSGGVERASERIQQYYASDIGHGRLSMAEAEAGLRRLRITPKYSDLAGSTFVIESVAEDLSAKQSVLAAVEANTSADCVFATNTSSIPISHIAAGALRPANVIGTHYFWPAHRFRLVETASAETTSESTLQRTLDFIRWQRKIPLLVRDLPGFFTTRVILVYLNEAIALVTEGVSIEAVDAAMETFGWPMGPFRLLDAIGIEKFPEIYRVVRGHLRDRIHHIERLWSLVQRGYVGCRGRHREGAKGFYRYPAGVEVDIDVYPLIGRERGTPPDSTEVATRPLWQMINEIGYCLAEGVVASAGDADLGAILGLGWPQVHEGPLSYARRVGVPIIVDQLRAWAQRDGPRFAPSQGLLASTVITSYSLRGASSARA